MSDPNQRIVQLRHEGRLLSMLLTDRLDEPPVSRQETGKHMGLAYQDYMKRFCSSPYKKPICIPATFEVVYEPNVRHVTETVPYKPDPLKPRKNWESPCL